MSSTILGPPTGYVDIMLENLGEHLRQQHENGTNFQRTPIRPSASGKCARELYYELMQYSGKAKYTTPVMEPETDLLLNLGHYVENHIINKFKSNLKMADVRYQQQVLDFGYIEAVNDKALSQHLEGSIDKCLWSEQWKCVVDIKSKGDSYDFRGRGYKWDMDTKKLAAMKSVEQLSKRAFWVNDLDAFLQELEDPWFAANFKQLNMYCNSDFLKKRGIDHGAIVQYQKNKSKLREVRFRPSVSVYEQTITKFKNVVRAVDENLPELAPQEYEQGSYKCNYCPFQKECWGKKK